VKGPDRHVAVGRGHADREHARLRLDRAAVEKDHLRPRAQDVAGLRAGREVAGGDVADLALVRGLDPAGRAGAALDEREALAGRGAEPRRGGRREQHELAGQE